MAISREALRDIYLKFQYEPQNNFFTCAGNARSIVEELARHDIPARIYEVDDYLDPSVSHCFVVMDQQGDVDHPLNAPLYDRRSGRVVTVKEVRGRGVDVTKALFQCDWSEL